MTDVDRYPIAWVTRREPDLKHPGYVQLTVRCPLCGREHYHGGGADDLDHGHRVAHCGGDFCRSRQRLHGPGAPMSASRPEHQDVFGLWHRHGCSAGRVTRRPAHLRPEWTYVHCPECGAVCLVRPDVETTTPERTR